MRSRRGCSLQRSRLDLTQIVRETIEDNREHLERGGVRLETTLTQAPGADRRLDAAASRRW